MPLSKTANIFKRLLKREMWMWCSGLGVVVIFFAVSNLPLWFYMQVHGITVEYPNVSMRRTVTLPVTLRYREEVENSSGYIFAQCDRTNVRPYEWRGLEPVNFKLRCRDLPDGSYTFRVCWFNDGSYLGCRATDFDVPASATEQHETRSSSPSPDGEIREEQARTNGSEED